MPLQIWEQARKASQQGWVRDSKVQCWERHSWNITHTRTWGNSPEMQLPSKGDSDPTAPSPRPDLRLHRLTLLELILNIDSQAPERGGRFCKDSWPIWGPTRFPSCRICLVMEITVLEKINISKSVDGDSLLGHKLNINELKVWKHQKPWELVLVSYKEKRNRKCCFKIWSVEKL